MLEETKTEQLKARQLEAKYNVSDELAASAGDMMMMQMSAVRGGGTLDASNVRSADMMCKGQSRLASTARSVRKMGGTTSPSSSYSPMGGTTSIAQGNGHIAVQIESTAAAVVSSDVYGIPDVQPSPSHSPMIDYTKYPSKLDASYELLDPDSKFRATIINVGKNWTKSSQASLLSGSSTTHLSEPQLDSEKYAAFDLLDALTKSGALPIEHASLHVVIAGTQCFDQSLMDAVVCRNINPIDRVERSTLIMASTLYNEPVRELIHADQVQRVGALSPKLFIEE